MPDSGRHHRLILAYLIVGFAVLALVGGVIGNVQLAVTGIAFGYMLAMIHGVSFFIRVRKRRAPARLDPTGRRILAATLGAVGAVAIGNLITVTVVLQGKTVVAPAQLGAVSLWMVLIGVLCWRAWILPSARRAGVLQIVAVLLAMPGVFGTVIEATDPKRSPPMLALGDRGALATGLFIAFAVVTCAGPVLDKLFAAVPDKEPEVVPEAVLRA
jgi:hypothetical protein